MRRRSRTKRCASTENALLKVAPDGHVFVGDPCIGERLWLATGNTDLPCGHPFVSTTGPIASLFAIEVNDAGFGGVETVAADFALFGDGAAFNAEGNLCVIFDTQTDFMPEESAIWVLPAGARALEKVAALRGTSVIMAGCGAWSPRCWSWLAPRCWTSDPRRVCAGPGQRRQSHGAAPGRAGAKRTWVSGNRRGSGCCSS